MTKTPAFRTISVFLIFMLCIFSLSCYEPKVQNGEEQNSTAEVAMLLSSSENIPEQDSAAIPVAVAKDTNVLLKVDTENITEDNKDEFVLIFDDRSESFEGIPPSEHIALVDKNMKIYWSAEALNTQSGVTVDVVGIFRKTEGGSEILDGVFRDPNKDGIIMGKLKNKKVDGLEYYNILIRINDETPRTFLIDPKLKMLN